MGSPQIVFLKTYLTEGSQELRSNFLQFVTGSGKIPFGGIRHLKSESGAQRKISISKFTHDNNSLPTASTCFNQMNLPEYPTY